MNEMLLEMYGALSENIMSTNVKGIVNHALSYLKLDEEMDS